MAQRTINVLITSFPGLGLPPTLSVPVDSSASLADLKQKLSCDLLQIGCRFILTTNSNREVRSSLDPITSLLSNSHDDFLPLRLTVPLCGGKGGFGSQLRAAGGRMSSKRKNNQGDINNSNRNLDGQRLRTVEEAKHLAKHLALKTKVEKKQKEEQRKRWEQAIEQAERRKEEVLNGSRGKVDGKWVEDKEESREQAREAVRVAMSSGDYHDNLHDPMKGNTSRNTSLDREESDDEAIEQLKQAQCSSNGESTALAVSSRSFFGFEDDDSSDDEDEQVPGGRELLETRRPREQEV